MGKQIEYWLVRKWNAIRENEYFCVSASGETDVTENPKRAMRWMTYEGAAQAAERLGWPWFAVKVLFDGSEMAG